MRVGAKPENPLEALALRLNQVPTPLLEGYMAFMGARVIMAGCRLGIFEALAERPDSAERLASRLGLAPEGTQVLLSALHASGCVTHGSGGYANSRAVQKYLLPGSDQSVAEFVGVFGFDLWDHFTQLEDVVRSGTPVGLHEREADDPYWERYIRGLFALTRVSARVVVRLVGAKDPRDMLDLAGGHGGYAMALCRKHPELRATILELEGSARVGREIVEEEGFSDRVRFEVGDIFSSDYGSGRDLVTAFQIVHHFSPEQNVDMLTRARASLRPGGGRMAIAEQEAAPPGEQGSQIGALTGMLFYITSAARTYTAGEMEGFLAQAGFKRPRSRRDPRLPGGVVVLGEA